MSADIKNQLTVEVARAICTWAASHYEKRYSVGKRVYEVRFMSSLDGDARDFLITCCGGEHLIPTSMGLAIESAAVATPVALALDFLKRAGLPIVPAEEPDVEIKDLIKDEPEAPVVRKVLEVPPEGVRWPLCTEPLPTAEEIEEDCRSTPERRSALRQLVEAPERWLPRASQAQIDTIRSLDESYPNFRSVIDYYCRDLQLQKRSGGSLRLPPVLLLGPPGLGKTQFAKALARALDLHLRLQSMAEITAGWILTGSSRKWNDASPGVIARHVTACPMGQAPMIVFDELDKAHPHQNYPSDTALLGLLESHTAQAFRDENLDLVLDVSPMSCLLTANRTTGVRPEILSRLKVIEIATPTSAQMPAIVRSVDAALRQESPALAKVFEPLDQAIVSSLGARPPRDLRRLLRDAYALVVEREDRDEQSLRLTLADLEAVAGHRSAPSVPAWRHIPIMVDPPGPRRLH